jgi:hypothetical protein
MPAISYGYNRYEFERHFDQPLTEAEYKLAKKDFYNFYHDVIDAAEEKFSRMKNPHAFKWIHLWIKLGLGVFFTGINLGLKALGYYDAGEVFAMISFIPFFAVVIQPFQWLLSQSKSSTFQTYEKHARDYYLFQYSKMKDAVSYHDYKIKLSEADAMEFMRFDWEDEAEAISEPVAPVEN